ncbi:MAG: hypothetical protein ACRC1S_09045, partial [Vibrio sp.]
MIFLNFFELKRNFRVISADFLCDDVDCRRQECDTGKVTTWPTGVIPFLITAFSDFTTANHALSPPCQSHEKLAKLDTQCRVLLRYARCNLPTNKLSDHLRVNMSAFLNFTARDHAIKSDHLRLVIT